jgi:hypothetical protein
VLGFGGRPFLLAGVTAALCLFTTLPWLSGILLTDIFAALAVLAAYLLMFCFEALSRFERRALIALIAFSVATHSATFAVVLALVLAVALARSVRGIRAPHGIGRSGIVRSGIVQSGLALVLGALLLLGANYVTAGRLAWTPGGIALSFGRMLQDGIVARYLDEHCPDKRLRLCAYRHELPTDADAFFWSGDGTVFNKLGRFAGLGDEMGLVVTESLRAYPAWQLEAAAVATLRQLVRVSTGEGVVNTVWHSYAIIEKFTPHAKPAMRAARQQRGELSFNAINDIQRPLALAAMLLLVPLMLWGSQRQSMADFGRLAATAACALLANAMVCGIFSNPHDRYGARLAWLAPLAVGLAAYRLYEQRKDAEAALPAQSAVSAGSTRP